VNLLYFLLGADGHTLSAGKGPQHGRRLGASPRLLQVAILIAASISTTFTCHRTARRRSRWCCLQWKFEVARDVFLLALSPLRCNLCPFPAGMVTVVAPGSFPACVHLGISATSTGKTPTGWMPELCGTSVTPWPLVLAAVSACGGACRRRTESHCRSEAHLGLALDVGPAALIGSGSGDAA